MNLVTESTESRPEESTGSHTLALLSDTDLLDAWGRDRHAASLAVLVDRYSVMVLSVCRRRCRSEADADDAFQSTFLYLARNSHKIRQPERLVGWLHRVAQRAAVATLKSTKRETEPMVEPPADPDDPLDRLTQRHEAIVLDEELADLPEHYRSAIVMHLYEGHPIHSLAEHFGTTVGSIRGRLQRGKQLLAQRLRRRGVVPVLAIAAANAWTVSTSQAAGAGTKFVDATCDGNLPDPPIDTPLLESLLAQGVRLMPSLYTTMGLVGGSALIALMMANGIEGQSTSDMTELSFSSSPVVAQFGGTPNVVAENNNDQASEGADTAGGGGGTADPTKLVWSERAVVPEPTSAVALSVMNSLDQEIELQISTTLENLPGVLREAAEIPVLMDDRGVAFAELGNETVQIEFEESSIPLSTALRRMLRPLGLKAVVEDEGLVITADPSALVHKEIGTSRWINIDEQAEKKIAAALDSDTDVEFVEVPLEEAIDSIAKQHKIPILVDRRALEEIGLSAEEPVTIALSGIKLRTALQFILRELGLTYMVHGESMEVTTVEAAETRLLSRIYWLEGTGFAVGSNPPGYQSIIDLIQTSIVPDTWEALGGPSTMAPVTSTRPALMINTTYPVHENIETVFQTLRETHFGRDPVLERVQVPAKQGAAMGGGGGGFGGGGFF